MIVPVATPVDLTPVWAVLSSSVILSGVAGLFLARAEARRDACVSPVLEERPTAREASTPSQRQAA